MACQKSWAATALSLGSSLLFSAVTALFQLLFSSVVSKFHSWRALPLRCPANCINSSSSLHAFHTPAHSKLGSQSPRSSSCLSPVNCSTGGAFPHRRTLAGSECSLCLMTCRPTGGGGGGGGGKMLRNRKERNRRRERLFSGRIQRIMWWVLSRSLRQLQILHHSTFFLSSLSCTLHMTIFTDGS